MSDKAAKDPPVESEDSDKARLRKALQEREAHLKEQIEKAEALPEASTEKNALVNQFKRYLDEVRKELRK